MCGGAAAALCHSWVQPPLPAPSPRERQESYRNPTGAIRAWKRSGRLFPWWEIVGRGHSPEQLHVHRVRSAMLGTLRSLPAAGRERRVGPEPQPPPSQTPPRAQEVGGEGRACLLWLPQPLWFWQGAASRRPRPHLRGVSGASRAPPGTGAEASTSLGALSAPQAAAERCRGFCLPPCSLPPEPGISIRGWRGQKGTFIFLLLFVWSGRTALQRSGTSSREGLSRFSVAVLAQSFGKCHP